MAQKDRKGKFIVIEGTDGSGKGTQVKLLSDYLKRKKKKFGIADFPQYENFSSGFVSKYLRGEYGTTKEVGPYRGSIFFSLDRYDKSFDIRKWLKEGKIVISNRYTSANMGHQAGQIHNKKARDKYLSWLAELEYGILGIPKPDLTILLYAPPEVGQKMVDKKGIRKYVGGQKRDMLESDINHLRQAAEAYRYVARKYKWKIIDCAPNGTMRSRDEIHKEILKLIKL